MTIFECKSHTVLNRHDNFGFNQQEQELSQGIMLAHLVALPTNKQNSTLLYQVNFSLTFSFFSQAHFVKWEIFALFVVSPMSLHLMPALVKNVWIFFCSPLSWCSGTRGVLHLVRQIKCAHCIFIWLTNKKTQRGPSDWRGFTCFLIPSNDKLGQWEVISAMFNETSHDKTLQLEIVYFEWSMTAWGFRLPSITVGFGHIGMLGCCYSCSRCQGAQSRFLSHFTNCPQRTLPLLISLSWQFLKSNHKTLWRCTVRGKNEYGLQDFCCRNTLPIKSIRPQTFAA